jgi:hypothetical protein
MKAGGLKSVLAVLSLIFCAVLEIAGQRERKVQWHVDADLQLVESDKNAILKLVRQIGLEPESVFVVTLLPSGDRLIYVSSPIIVEGNHRAWTELSVCRTDWNFCNNKTNRSLKRVGRWLASKADLERRERWRIHDGDWSMDIPVQSGVRFADAEQIVLVIRHKQLVNRVPTVAGPPRLNVTVADINVIADINPIADVNPDEISQITRVVSDTGVYEVTIGVGSGVVLRVKIIGNSVELQGYSTFTV